MGKHRRGSTSESGMRLLRRLEKNHDGIRSAATRQHYIQIGLDHRVGHPTAF